jgi:hypothetical protein
MAPSWFCAGAAFISLGCALDSDGAAAGIAASSSPILRLFERAVASPRIDEEEPAPVPVAEEDVADLGFLYVLLAVNSSIDLFSAVSLRMKGTLTTAAGILLLPVASLEPLNFTLIYTQKKSLG